MLSWNIQSEEMKGLSADEETRKKMIEILQRFGHFGLGENEEFQSTSSLGFLGEFSADEIKKMNLDELKRRIGPESVTKFEESGELTKKLLEESINSWHPWWLANINLNQDNDKEDQESLINVPEPLEDLPPLKQLTSSRPPESLWNNLVELIYLYAFLNRIYTDETKTLSEHFAKDLLKFSSSLTTLRFTHKSVIHAIRCTEGKILMDSETFFSDDTKALICSDLLCLLSSGDNVKRAMGDLQRIMECAADKNKNNFMAAKKIYFYIVWFHDEYFTDKDLVETVLVSIRSLIESHCEENCLISQLDPIKTKNVIIKMKDSQININ